MNKIKFLLINSLVTSISFAQGIKESEVPKIVKSAFEKAYPTVKTAKWEKEETNYEAEFTLNKSDNSVLISSTGAILETEIKILTSQLPKCALEYIKKNYTGCKIAEAAKITDSNGTLKYEAEIKGVDVFFDVNGNPIK